MLQHGTRLNGDDSHYPSSAGAVVADRANEPLGRRDIDLGIASRPGSLNEAAGTKPCPDWSVPARILIVEDQRLTATSLQTMVEGWGYRVVGIAGEADRAFQKAAGVRPDLVMVDVGLRSEPDGVFTGQTIHSALGVPVVYVTGRGDPAMLQERAGATPNTAVVQKPVHPDALRSALARALCA